MQEDRLFTNIGESVSKVTMQAYIGNTWISEEICKLHDMHLGLRHELVRFLDELYHIGNRIKVVLKIDHKRHAEKLGLDIKYLPRYEPSLVQKRCNRIQVWYKDTSNRDPDAHKVCHKFGHNGEYQYISVYVLPEGEHPGVRGTP